MFLLGGEKHRFEREGLKPGFFDGAGRRNEKVCQPKRLNGSGGTESAKVCVRMVEVSRGPEPGFCPGERFECSVIGRCLRSQVTR